MRNLKIIFFISAILFCSFTKVQAQARWRFIAEKTVDFHLDRDVIKFGNIGDEFRQLQLRVSDGALKMYDMKIYYDNGSVQDVDLRKNFGRGSSSRIIQLTGGRRHLERIEFHYETKGFLNGRARVAVWGRK
jgi:hypothetical protein